MKTFYLLLVPTFIFAACSSDGPDGNDANDSTENALQHVGNRIEDGLKEAVDSGVPKLGRAVDRADTVLQKVGDKVERAGDRIERRFNEGRNRSDTAR